MNRKTFDLVICSALAAGALMLALLVPEYAPVRALVALPLVLFVPGYAIVAAAFPASRLGTIERLLLSLTPHMHLRGKSFRYEAVFADGRRETLLDVPRWDFNWQLDYILAEPKLMPAGSKIVCTAYFDNSAENPANPDPSKWVRFGEQSWDEMMMGWFTAATLPGAKANETARASAGK